MELILQRYLYINDNIKELKQYNDYYLVRTLLTANNDIKELKQIEEKTKQKYNELYNISKEILRTNYSNLKKFFTEEQNEKIIWIINN